MEADDFSEAPYAGGMARTVHPAGVSILEIHSLVLLNDVEKGYSIPPSRRRRRSKRAAY